MNSESCSRKTYLGWFEKICSIPHESRNEQELSNFLVEFAKERHLAVSQDEKGNILIRKPGTSGMEHAPTVILQGHMDMVCVKDEGLDFDFARDPLRLVTEGDRLHADGTSLGADNGIALAYILALLDSDNVPHPPLEAVVTVDEEVGMGGATAFDASQLTASLFINMDSEDEGVFCVSCAGGRRSRLHIPAETEDAAPLVGNGKGHFYLITVTGLAGGHSGLEIIKERGNSNKLLARVLDDLARRFPCRIVSLNGGTAANAIPKESSAVVLTSAEEKELRSELDSWTEIFRHELRGADGAGLVITLADAAPADKVLTERCATNVISAALLIPSGIASMDMNITSQRLVESSNNFAMIRMEGGEIVFHCQTRSSVASKKEALCRQIDVLAAMIGATVEHSGDYPAWEYRQDSSLRDLMTEVFQEQYGRKPKIEAIHAGVECGILSGKLPGLDCVSIGPNLLDIHTPRERMEIASVQRVWRFVLEVLKRSK